MPCHLHNGENSKVKFSKHHHGEHSDKINQGHNTKHFKTRTKNSNYFNHNYSSGNHKKSEYKSCDSHGKNQNLSTIATDQMPKEFRHACHMCPGDFSHTSCKYCLDQQEEPDEQNQPKDFTHASCNCCSNNDFGEKNRKKKFAHTTTKSHDFPESPCRYCLEDIPKNDIQCNHSDISDNDSLDDFFDDINSPPCLLHRSYKHALDSINPTGCIYKPSYYGSHNWKTICQNNKRRLNLCTRPSFYDLDAHSRENSHYSRLASGADIHKLSDIFAMGKSNGIKLEENINAVFTSINCNPCEFCLRNGEASVICNSHELRNSRGHITCPILKHYTYEITGTSECHTNAYLQNLQPCCDLHSPINDPLLETNWNRDNTCCELNEDFLHMRHFNNFSNDQYLPNTNPRRFQNYRLNNSNLLPCQFCLANGEPPHIYNSHQMRDSTGRILMCPFLKQYANSTDNSNARRNHSNKPEARRYRR